MQHLAIARRRSAASTLAHRQRSAIPGSRQVRADRGQTPAEPSAASHCARNRCTRARAAYSVCDGWPPGSDMPSTRPRLENNVRAAVKNPAEVAGGSCAASSRRRRNDRDAGGAAVFAWPSPRPPGSGPRGGDDARNPGRDDGRAQAGDLPTWEHGKRHIDVAPLALPRASAPPVRRGAAPAASSRADDDPALTFTARRGLGAVAPGPASSVSAISIKLRSRALPPALLAYDPRIRKIICGLGGRGMSRRTILRSRP